MQVKLSENKPTDTLVLLSETYTNLLNKAYEKDKIDEVTYERLRRQPIQTLDDADTAYRLFTDSLRGRLLERIIKGAEYIEQHGYVPAAVSKYGRICEELAKLDGRNQNEYTS